MSLSVTGFGRSEVWISEVGRSDVRLLRRHLFTLPFSGELGKSESVVPSPFAKKSFLASPCYIYSTGTQQVGLIDANEMKIIVSSSKTRYK